MHLTYPPSNQSNQSNHRSPRNHHIAFLHTAAAHVATFSEWMTIIAPELNALHIVREDLLIDAQQPSIGIHNPALAMRIKRATRHAGDSGARIVVCTCSTIGGMVEALDVKAKKQVILTTRIDRAMADAAAKNAAPIILVATLESTLEPSAALLQESAAAVDTYARITPLLVKDAWPHFLAGDQTRYIDCIVSAVLKAHATFNRANNLPPSANTNTAAPIVAPTIVLAQASMQAAVAPLAARGITALCSPELGVRHAVALYTSYTPLPTTPAVPTTPAAPTTPTTPTAPSRNTKP
jgi:hypothetical protein